MNTLRSLLAFLLGIDISHWSGVVDWATVRANNIVQFVIAKCTEGINFLDSQWNNNRNGCLAQKLPIGGYHFYLPTGNPEAQADYCMSKLGKSPPFVVVCDVETAVLNAIYGEEAVRKGVGRGMDEKQWKSLIASARILAGNEQTLHHEKWVAIDKMLNSLSSLSDDVKTFMERVEAAGYTSVIYSSPGFMASYFRNCDWLINFVLWIAHIGVDTPTIPYPYNQYGAFGVNPYVKIWQHTWTLVVDGVPEAAVDGNMWWSASDNLYAWFGNGEPYGGQNPMPNYVMAQYSNVRIRTSVWGTFVAYADMNIAYKVLEQKADTVTPGRWWYRIGTNRWIAGWYCNLYN